MNDMTTIGTINHNEPEKGRIALYWSSASQSICDAEGVVLESGVPTLREAARRAQSAWSGVWDLELTEKAVKALVHDEE